MLIAARPTKGNRSLIMRGKWKSFQEWLIFMDSARNMKRITFHNKRGINQDTSVAEGKNIARTNKRHECTKSMQGAI